MAVPGNDRAGVLEHGGLHGVLAPHGAIDGIDGGRVFANAYSLVRAFRPTHVVVVAENHVKAIEKEGVFVPPFTHFTTPLADLAVNFELGDAVCREFPQATLLPAKEAFEHQHPVEMALMGVAAAFLGEGSLGLPWIFPVVLGVPPRGMGQGRNGYVIGEAMARAIRENPGMRLLLVATSDLCHHRQFEYTRRLDEETKIHLRRQRRQALFEHWLRCADRSGFESKYTIPVCSPSAVSSLFGLGNAMRDSMVELGYGSTHVDGGRDCESYSFAAMALIQPKDPTAVQIDGPARED